MRNTVDTVAGGNSGCSSPSWVFKRDDQVREDDRAHKAYQKERAHKNLVSAKTKGANVYESQWSAERKGGRGSRTELD